MRTQSGYLVQQAIGAYFPNAVFSILDVDYATLTEHAWKSLHGQFSYDMIQRGIPDWLTEKGDCDDWAWLFRAWVIERNWRQHASRVPVALFYLHYTTREGVVHAINAAIVLRDDELTVLPIEPQRNNGGPFEMTTNERLSCTMIIG